MPGAISLNLRGLLVHVPDPPDSALVQNHWPPSRLNSFVRLVCRSVASRSVEPKRCFERVRHAARPSFAVLTYLEVYDNDSSQFTMELESAGSLPLFVRSPTGGAANLRHDLGH